MKITKAEANFILNHRKAVAEDDKSKGRKIIESFENVPVRFLFESNDPLYFTVEVQGKFKIEGDAGELQLIMKLPSGIFDITLDEFDKVKVIKEGKYIQFKKNKTLFSIEKL